MVPTEKEADNASPTGSQIPSPCEQRDIVKPSLRPTLEAGDCWYMVGHKWFTQWKKFVNFDAFNSSSSAFEAPGPVDLSELIDADGELQENLLDDLDYCLLPEHIWEKLVVWYGLMEEQKPLKRRVVEQGMFVKHCRVEVYLMKLKLKLHGTDDGSKPIVKGFSKVDTLQEVMDVMKEAFEIDSETECRLWSDIGLTNRDLLSDLSKDLADSGLYENSLVLLEAKAADGTWPLGEAKKSPASSSSYVTNGSGTYASTPKTTTSDAISTSSASASNSRGLFGSPWNFGFGSSEPSKPGLCGLSNLGNTCFMNSALQCLSNTQPLTEYFLEGTHKKELNKDNPLGMKGMIATAYGDLMSEMWRGSANAVAPRAFKQNVGKFAPQFSGFAQHDSQELLAFVMDGLHEDLNRVKKKPYTEVKEHEDCDDEKVAKEAWQDHLKRNDSIMVELFHGQFKSRLHCPECDKVSIIFDPFMFLQVPLPVERKRVLKVSVIRKDLSCKPLRVHVNVPKGGSVSDVLAAVGKVCDLPTNCLIMADVYGNRLHKVFKPLAAISSIYDRDEIVAYELPCPVSDTNVNGNMALVLLYFRRKKSFTSGSYMSSSTIYSSWELFSRPHVTCVPRKETTSYQSVYSAVETHVKPLLLAEDGSNNGGTLLHLASTSEQSSSVTENDDASDRNNERQDIQESSTTSEEEKKPQAEAPLFEMTYVNTVGSVEISGMSRSSSIKLAAENYIGLNWSSDKHYNAKAADSMEMHSSCQETASEPTKTIVLDDCIELFLTEEQLSEKDPWYCPRCKEHRRAFKKFDLWKLPDVLVIQLKRFSYNSLWRDKIDRLIQFPKEGLDLTRHCPHDKEAIYDLHAVSNHYGGMGGGHYTAYAKNSSTDQWHHFDDSSVRPAGGNDIVSSGAYVLFYQRRRGAPV